MKKKILFLTLFIGMMEIVSTGIVQYDGLYADDFESGSPYQNWTINSMESGDSFNIQTSTVYQGSYAALYDQDGDGNGNVAIQRDIPDSKAIGTESGKNVTFGWFRTDNPDFDSNDIVVFSSSFPARSILLRRGYIELKGDIGSWGECRISYNTDTWYKVKVGFKTSGSEVLYITPKGGSTSSTVCNVIESGSKISWIGYFRDTGAFPESAKVWGDLMFYSSNASITEDATAPSITVHEPVEQVYSSYGVSLKVSANEAITQWKYNLDGEGNTSFTPNTTISGLSDGNHAVTVYGTDSAGNTASATRSFSVDSTPPEYRNFKDNTSGEIAPGKSVNISVEFRDNVSGISQTVLATNESGRWNNKSSKYGSPNSFSGETASFELSSFEWQNSSFTGDLGYRVWGKDEAGNWEATEIQSVQINSPPVIESVAVGDAEPEEELRINVTATDTDGTIDDVYLNLTDPGGNAEVLNKSMTVSGFQAGNFSETLEEGALESEVNLSQHQSKSYGLRFNGDGSKVFIAARYGNVVEYNLSEPYDFSTKAFVEKHSFEVGGLDGVDFSEDGTKFYAVGYEDSKIYEYDLSTPYNLSAASLSSTLDTGNADMTDLLWADNGSTLFVGTYNGVIRRYNASTDFDVSSLNLAKEVNWNKKGNVESFSFNNNGRKFYSGGSGGIYEFSLVENFNVSSASYTGRSLETVQASTTNMVWNNNGSRVYLTDIDNIAVYQFSLYANPSKFKYLYSVGSESDNIGTWSAGFTAVDSFGLSSRDSTSFEVSDATAPQFRGVQDNASSGSTPRNSSVNISAELIDRESGLERALLSTNESGKWGNWSGVNFGDGFEDGDYTSDPAWSDESTGGSTSIVSDGAGGSSQALKLSDEGRFSGYSNYPELVHRREMKVTEATKFTFYVQMNNLGSDPIAQPDSRVKLGSEDGSYSLNIDQYLAQFNSNAGEQTKYHTLNEGKYYEAEIAFYPSNDTASNKLFDSTGTLVLSERLNYSGVETFQNITVNTNAGSGYSYDFKVDEFKFINGDYGSPIYLGGAADSWEPTSFEWRNSSFSGKLGYRIWAKDSSGNWNRTEIQSFTLNGIPKIQYVDLNWTDIGGSSETRILEYNISDPEAGDIADRNSPPEGSVTLFSNSTYRISEVPNVFDYTVSVSDFLGATGTHNTNYTLHKTEFREQPFNHDLSHQRLNQTVSAKNRGENLTLHIKMANPGSLVAGTNHFSGVLATGESVNITSVYESDFINSENKTQEELGQNFSRTSTADTQYLFNQTGLEVYNNQSFSFSNVDLSSKCSITQTANITSGSSKVTASCDNDSISGDWISNEKNYSTQYVSGTPLFGRGLDQKYTASQKVEATNVRTDLNLTVDLSSIVSDTGFCSIENSTKQEIAKDSVESLTFRKNCSGGQEASYTPVRKTETSSSYKYDYQAKLEVFSNLTENQSIKYGIPETRLDNFGSREPGETMVSIDGNSNDLSINDATVIDGTEYVVVEVGDQHGNSSLHKGTHNLSLTYYESKTQGSTSGGDSTGSGSLLVSSGSETTVDENNGSEYSWMVSAITSEDTKSFQINGYPGVSFEQFVVLRNTGDRNVSLNIDCVSQDNSCQYVDTDVDTVVLNRNSFTEKNVKVTGELPQNFSREDAPLTFSIRVTDPAWNGSSTSGESVSYVDFTVTHNPVQGRLLDLVLKSFEGFTIESPVDWGNNVTVPFILVPLVLSGIAAALVGLVEWLAPFSSGWESQRKLVEVLIVLAVFLILYVVIPAGG